MKGEHNVKSYFLGFFALACLIFGRPVAVEAGVDWVVYKPGIVKAAVARGETTFLFYKSTW